MLNHLRDSFTADDKRAEALLEKVCHYIERVHRVEGVAQYYFSVEELMAGAHGIHDRGVEVAVNSLTIHPVLVGIHELGHVLDGAFLNCIDLGGSPSDPPFEYASDLADNPRLAKNPIAPLLTNWFVAVQTSSYHRCLTKSAVEDDVSEPIQWQIRKLLRVRELWARSYEPFICRRNPKSKIAAQMDVECRDSALVGGARVHNYWQGNDFDSVENEIEIIFRRLGWLIN